MCEREQGADQPRVRLSFITPTKVKQATWAHLFGLVSSRMLASLPPAIDRTKSELLSHAPINRRLNTA